MRTAAALVCLLLLSAPASADGPTWKQVRSEFLRQFKERDEYTRGRAVLGLAGGGHPEAVDLLLRVLDDRPGPAIVAYGVSAIHRLAAGGCREQVIAGYRKAEPQVRAAILLGLRTHRQPEVRRLGMEALASEDALVRTAAVEALAGRAGPELAPPLLTALDDPAWPVAAAALERIRSLKVEDAARGLPPLLDSKRGRLRAGAYEALKTLTGKDLGLDRELWERWLDRGETASPAEDGYAAPTFYGIRVVGDAPVFVLDISGSMLEEIRVPVERLRAVTGKSAASARERIDWSRIRTKLDLAKAELVATLTDLPKTARFGLVFYSDSVAVWREALTPATPKNIEAAVRRVRGLGAIGNTNVYDSLLRALDLSGKGRVLAADPEGVDQILFLTDGNANRGAIRRDGAIRFVLRVLYWLRRVRIDCVGVGAHDKNLLEGLARDAKGRYVAVGG